MYQISKMKNEDIPKLIEIWHNQYSKYCNSAVIPDFLNGGENSIVAYLENQINRGNAIVSRNGDVITGYIAWMYFDFHKVHKPACQLDSIFKISVATYSDAEALLKLVKESVNFYIESPIFLKRGDYELDDVIDMIKTDYLLIAWGNDTPIGMMNLSVQTGYNIENLASANTGLISKVGAYIKPQYRGLGIGKCLINEVMKHCAEKDIQYLHVCFETANPYANIFWRKHFKSIILSVRRTVNKDANIAK